MKKTMLPNKVLWIPPLAIVAYDFVASLASRSMGFPYVYASVGSAIIYAVAGFFAANGSASATIFLVGVIMGLTDASLGWGISWVIGPGKAAGGTLSQGQWLIAAVSVTAFAIVFAFMGSFISHAVQSRSTA